MEAEPGYYARMGGETLRLNEVNVTKEALNVTKEAQVTLRQTTQEMYDAAGETQNINNEEVPELNSEYEEHPQEFIEDLYFIVDLLDESHADCACQALRENNERKKKELLLDGFKEMDCETVRSELTIF